MLPVALATALLGVALAAGLQAPASAHATLLASSPTEGAVLDRLPTSVSLSFSDELGSPVFVAVTTGEGTSVTSGKPSVAGAVVTQALGAGPAGAYTLAYRVVSADGHVVTGEVHFSVGAGSEEVDPTAAGRTVWWILAGGALVVLVLFTGLAARRSGS